MNQKLHPGPHPDADQLNVFVEGADTAREREQTLAHLAECEECRDVVFLMQRPMETSSPAKEMPKERPWQRWFVPAALAGTALAGLAVVLIYVRPWTRVPGSSRQGVAIEKPETAAPATPLVPSGNAAPTAEQQRAENGLATGAAGASAAPQGLGPVAASKTPKATHHPASGRGAIQPTDTVVVAGSAATTPEAGAAPKAAQLDANAAAVQQLPLSGRNAMNLPAPAPSGGAGAAAATDSALEAQQNPPALRVESSNSQGQTALALVGSLSAVSGRVTDASGGAVAGATVALRDASGSTRQAATGSDGSFRLVGIPAGHYDLTVTALGFNSNQQSIDLKPSELATLQPILAVGSVTETVEVTARAPALETDSTGAVSRTELPSRLPIISSVSLGKRMLSLDGAGSLFLSRNAGKSWKKVHPQWTGKPVGIAVSAAQAVEAKDKGETSSSETPPRVFRLTTGLGAQWTSKDGTHWRPQ